MNQHYSWPELGEDVCYRHVLGVVVARRMGTMELCIRDHFGSYIDVKLEDFIVDQIRNPK